MPDLNDETESETSVDAEIKKQLDAEKKKKPCEEADLVT
jgi:hypothetical protein